jgi:hypothetical protein
MSSEEPMNEHAGLAAIVAAVALAAPQLAYARPAVVRVFEAEARAAPTTDAPVVHRFPEGTELSVSEEAQEGWRRVRLPDGSTGWIEATALTIPESLTASARPAAPSQTVTLPPSPPPAPPKPDLHPRLIVEDAGQLPRLMQKDPTFAQQAQALAQRRTLSWVSFGLGVAAAIGFTVASVNSRNGPPPGDPSFGKTSPDVARYGLAGLGSFALGSLVALAVYPRRGDVIDLVNGWNLAHPEDPLEVEPILLVPAEATISGPPGISEGR